MEFKIVLKDTTFKSEDFYCSCWRAAGRGKKKEEDEEDEEEEMEDIREEGRKNNCIFTRFEIDQRCKSCFITD